MKASVFSQRFILLLVFFFFLCLMLPPPPTFSEDFAGQSLSDPYSQQELAQMLAPIALYPDALLSQVLIASTYPIEVIEADRWVKRNFRLDGDALDDALYAKEWDPSVKALCHFPSTLTRMSEQISETTNLGNAFLAQEDNVMGMVQHLRKKAYTEGNLYSTKQQQVIVERETIVIKPAHPQILYVPYYDPYYVYGSWWYPAYRPYYWGPSNVRLGFGISFSSGIYFNFSFGNWSYFDWHHHAIYFDTYKRPRFVRRHPVTSPPIWKHAPSHRRGVAYRDKRTAQIYGQVPHRSPESHRENRGYANGRNAVPQIRRNENNTRKIVKIKKNVSTPKKIYQQEQRKQVLRSTRQQPQMQSSSSRVLKQQPQQRKVRPEQNTRKMIQLKSSSSSQKQQRATRETQKSPQIRVPVQQRQKQQWQKRENVFNRGTDGTTERQSSQRGKASRRKSPLR